jgi:hypothetical protein
MVNLLLNARILIVNKLLIVRDNSAALTTVSMTQMQSLSRSRIH